MVRTPDWDVVCKGIDYITVDDLFAMTTVYAKKKLLHPMVSFLVMDMVSDLADMPPEEVREMLIEARRNWRNYG